MMESVWLPCRHMFHILKVEQIQQILENMVLRRQIRNVKDHNTYIAAKLEFDIEILKLVRFSVLSTTCNKMCYNTVKSVKAYEEALFEINQLIMNSDLNDQWD